MPTKRAEIKNIFLFMLLTRIIRKEIEKFQGEFSKNKLQEYLSKKGFEKAVTNTVFLHLCDFDTTRIVVTPTMLQQLINLVTSERIGETWNDFENNQLLELGFSEDIMDVYIRSNELSGDIHKLLYDKHSKDFDESKQLKVLNTNDFKYHEVKKLYGNLEEKVEKRLVEIYIEELYNIGNVKVSLEELRFVSFLLHFPDGFEEKFLHLIKKSSFNNTILPIELIVHRLCIKDIIFKHEGTVLLKEKIKAFVPETSIDLKPVFIDIAEATLTNYPKNAINLYRTVFFFQKAEEWEKADQILNTYIDTIRKASIYEYACNIIATQVSSNYFITNVKPWYWWNLAICYNAIGKLSQASDTIRNLFIYIRDNCTVNNHLKVNHTELFLKAFQLGIEIVLKYDDIEILKPQLNAIKLCAGQYLQIPKYFENVKPEVRWQLLTTLSYYFFKLDNVDYANKLITNLFDDFIDKEDSQTKANINLVKIEISVNHPETLKLFWAKTAYRYFKKKNNLNGIAKSSLYRALFEEESNEQEYYLKQYIEIIKRIKTFDIQLLPHLEKIKSIITNSELLEEIDREMERLESQKTINSLEKSLSLQLYQLINFDKQVYVDQLDFDFLLTTFKNEKGIISQISTPLHRNNNPSKKEIQTILDSDINSKVSFLSNAFNSAGNNYATFYCNEAVKDALVYTKIDKELILKLYFTHRLVEEIAKTKNDDFKLAYARKLNRDAPNRAKIILDSISFRNRNAEYYNLLGVYYSSIEKKDYGKSYYYHKKSLETLENQKYRGRYQNNFAWSLINLNKKSKFDEAKELFLSSIKLMDNPVLWPHPIVGIIIIKLLKNSWQPFNILRSIFHKEFDKLKLSNDNRIHIIDIIIKDYKHIILEKENVFISLMNKYKEGKI